MNYEVAWPIARKDSQKSESVLVPARMVDGELQPLKRTDFLIRGNQKREEILATAPAVASKVLQDLKINYVRDENKVIEYATLESENPLTASAVLAPEFAGKFAETLGPDILVAIPSRYLVYVFPRLAQGYKEMAEDIVIAYETAPFPVSKEVFQLRDGKLIAIGAYR